VAAWLAIYDEVRAAHAAAAGDPVSELRAAARYLRWLGPFVKQRLWREVVDRADAAERQAREEHDRAERWRGATDTVREERDRLEAEVAALRAVAAAHEDQRGRFEAQSQRLAAELVAVHDTATFRLRQRVLASPLLGGPTRMLVHLAKRGGVYR
jgi:hypothetical protein